MTNPYTIDVGERLYLKLFDDPRRPSNYTVQQWAVSLLSNLTTCLDCKFFAFGNCESPYGVCAFKPMEHK